MKKKILILALIGISGQVLSESVKKEFHSVEKIEKITTATWIDDKGQEVEGTQFRYDKKIYLVEESPKELEKMITESGSEDFKLVSIIGINGHILEESQDMDFRSGEIEKISEEVWKNEKGEEVEGTQFRYRRRVYLTKVKGSDLNTASAKPSTKSGSASKKVAAKKPASKAKSK